MMPAAAFRRNDGSWLVFDTPIRTLCATTQAEVLPCLQEVERYVHEGLYAAGFVSYEAAPAFDQALAAFPVDEFPLVWFAVYYQPSILSLPLPERTMYQDPTWQPSMSTSEYRRALEKILGFIAEGDTYQVNFTFRLKSAFTMDPWEYFRLVDQGHPMPYASFINTGRYAVCSFSPELFFCLEGKSITAQPMKGTSRRGRYCEEDALVSFQLKNSGKERAENIMIVDMIRNDISRIASSRAISVPEICIVRKFSTIFQMISTVQGETAASITDIMKALFPCASITGAPKIRTSEILAALETTPRHLYCGTIGWYGPERQACFNVAIRTVVVDTLLGEAEYGTGSGIVWESSVENEFEECRLKAQIVIKPQEPFSLIETLLWDCNKGYFLLDRHVKRLCESAQYFDFSVDIAKVKAMLLQFVAAGDRCRSKVRLSLESDGTVSIDSIHLDDEAIIGSTIIMMSLTDSPVNSADRFLFHKTTHREHYSQARARVPVGDDLVFYNEKDEITETLIGNIVMEIDNRFYTPPIECGLLGGVFREWLISRNFIQEKIIKKEDIYRATRIYRVNSVRKWQRCRLVGK
jgi:para-aminobenzoate synthetase/4-amino-4-deoxychorismate lyase